MAKATAKTTSGNRLVSKERRREQLIQSTINCIARRGIAGTTMADVTSDAGLSLGIVNLHFKSKEKLFEETLLYLSNEYEHACINACNKSNNSAAESLRALVELDFSPRVCDRKKLAVWFAFWGEAKSRPTYLDICAQNDKKNYDMVTELCEQIIEDADDRDAQAHLIATGLAALTNGLWLDLLMTPNDINRKQARDICLDYLAAKCPGHFN